jgi:hypothetical protein
VLRRCARARRCGLDRLHDGASARQDVDIHAAHRLPCESRVLFSLGRLTHEPAVAHPRHFSPIKNDSGARVKHRGVKGFLGLLPRTIRRPILDRSYNVPPDALAPRAAMAMPSFDPPPIAPMTGQFNRAPLVKSSFLHALAAAHPHDTGMSLSAAAAALCPHVVLA